MPGVWRRNPEKTKSRTGNSSRYKPGVLAAILTPFFSPVPPTPEYGIKRVGVPGPSVLVEWIHVNERKAASKAQNAPSSGAFCDFSGFVSVWDLPQCQKLFFCWGLLEFAQAMVPQK